MSSGENTRLVAGRYRVVAQLGRGGMGVVWRAFDEVLGREVAVKELRTYTDASSPELADLRVRMQREARAAARVSHPGVIAVHDVTEHEGRPVIVMELIDGPSLDDVLGGRGVLDPREAAGIGAKVLQALAAAHAAGVLHRDVKPGNVLLANDGRVVLTDFGIAAMDDPGDGRSTHLTRSGELVGSLDYLAPERAQGQEPGPASDVWALGATLYAAVEGASPFRRTSTWSTLSAIVQEPLPEPRRAGELGPILAQLMDKDPAMRPDAQTAARLLSAVASEGGTGSTVPLSPGGAAARVPTVLNAAAPPVAGFGPAQDAPQGFGAPQQPYGAPHPAPYPARPFSPVPPATVPPTGIGGAPAPEPAARGGRSRALVAAGVVAVLLAGGGVTYLLSGQDEKPKSAPVAAGSSPSESGTGGEDGDVAPGAGPAEPGGSRSPKPGKSEEGKGEKGKGGKDGDEAKPSKSAGPDAGSSREPARKAPTAKPSGAVTESKPPAGGGGGSAEQPETPVCHPIGGGKYNCTVWSRAVSYRADGSRAGHLNAGTNYFYCQSNLGRRETSGRWTNVWWARTDDDSGNTNVYVSDVWIKGGENDRPVPGLPHC
ncbi:protein kinase [Streptomyces sp. NPDC050504]|uniref:serine/threonine-protein kinase n=1 Tax=Streptomyces sp. NPDC050504 TaxID=3365618 RepID=UPI0037B666FF